VSVLVLSAHPDDETLGAGGTLLKHAAAGRALHWLVATRATPPEWPEELCREKSAEAEVAAARYGMESTTFLNHVSGRLADVSQEQLMREIGDVVAETRPDTVYVVHGGDVHTDHRALFEAAMSAIKPFRMKKKGVSIILCRLGGTICPSLDFALLL